jgi:hypothetical protein
MAWLKTLVIGMGVLIVAGIAVVAVTMVNRMGGGAAPSATAPVAGRVALPGGARILDAHADGKLIVVRIALADGGTRVAVYDLDGKPVSTLDFAP